MLLSQQAMLVRLDSQRAVVRVSSNWMPMVQSRLSLLETAVGKALGSPRQLVLEGGDPTTLQAAAPPPAPAAPAPSPRGPASSNGSGPADQGATAPASEPPDPEPAVTAASSTAPAAGPGDTPTQAQAPARAIEAEPATRQSTARPAVPDPTERTAPPATAGQPIADNRQQQQLDEKARRLADFFNGEVITLDEPIEDGGAAA